MKNKKYIFILLACGFVLPVRGDSLLQAVQFPKTFNDVDFETKYAILAEGYGMFDRQYDEQGRCIQGCPYIGITIEQDQQDTDEATDYFASLVDGAVPEGGGSTPDDPADNPGSDSKKKIVSTPPSGGGYSQNSLPLRSPVSVSNILITGDFGWRQMDNRQYMHNGIDIGIATGTPIYASGDGTVQRVTTGCRQGDKSCGGGNGNYVLIQHSHGLNSEYKHLNSVSVSQGANVQAGQLIGYSGDTGYSFGPHLHYDIYISKNGSPAYIDILCPCVGTRKTKKYNESLTNINTVYSCKHCAMNRQYKFKVGEKKTKWRIASGHCMTNANDKLPDEL